MRNHWSGRLGFILAAVGSAVGLGNVWKFPFITGMNGGGAFVVVYLLALLTCGLPILMAELLIGRHSQRDIVGSFATLTPKSTFWQGVGWLNLLAAFIILSYYAVIAGWTLDYLFKSFTGAFNGKDPDTIVRMFGELATNPFKQLFWFTLFMGFCLLSVISGVEKGLERWNKILMPTLFVILFLMAGYAMTTSEAMAGLRFMLYPDFAKLSLNGVLEAIGQSFYTLSLAMGVMVTYASYMDRNEPIFPMATRIIFLDTVVAVVVGVAIFPIVFSVGLEPDSGPGLIFKTLPQVFSTIPFGAFLSVIFFILLAFAALSSAISLLEVLTAFMIDGKKMSRKKATIFMTIAVYLAGIPSALSYSVLNKVKLLPGKEVLDSLDYVASNYLLPIGGILIAIYTGYILNTRISQAEITEDGRSSLRIFSIWYFTIRYIAPLVLLIVFLSKIGLITI